MDFQNKTFLISDPLHGSIQVSELEKRLISTEVFNRLHHILQNSTVFLTFPSNKTSRFMHSIGVMHLGGEMYKFGMTNGMIDEDGEIVKSFLESMHEYIKELTANDFFNGDLNEFKITNYESEFANIIKVKWNEPFYTANIPNSLTEPHLLYTYVVTFQALRCVALLHDLGHPPFSHITEKSLENIYKSLEKKLVENVTLTPREKYFHKTLKTYIDEDKLHERIGKILSSQIFNKVISETDSNKKIFYLHIKYITNAILYDEQHDKNIFNALHGIVDGEIDCDRLDYVSRDMLASGIDSGTVEYQRLYKSMKLLRENNLFSFCPSSHILGTIEDFFNRRWRMYKNIIFHHRVSKTDTMLQEVIEKLAYRYLNSNDEEIPNNDFKIPSDISGLWKTLDLDFSSPQAIYSIIQWDDSWLLACLRTEYFQLISTGKQSVETDIITRLEELLSNRKKYTSLFKRSDGFYELDSEILNNFNFSVLERFQEETTVKSMVNRLQLYSKNPEMQKAQLFTYILDEFFVKHPKLGLNSMDKLIQDALNEVIGNKNDFIFKRNKIKTGIGESPQPAKIHTNMEIHLLEDYSNIKTQLTAEKALFAPFYIYINSEKIEEDLSLIRKAIGKTIANKLVINLMGVTENV